MRRYVRHPSVGSLPNEREAEIDFFDSGIHPDGSRDTKRTIRPESSFVTYPLHCNLFCALGHILLIVTPILLIFKVISVKRQWFHHF